MVRSWTLRCFCSWMGCSAGPTSRRGSATCSTNCWTCRSKADDLVSEHLVVLLTDAQLDALAERVAAKLANGNGHHLPEPDKLLTAVEAAERLGVTVRCIYGRPSSLPFAAKLPNRR